MTEATPAYADRNCLHVSTCDCDACVIERLTAEVELLQQTVRARDASIRQLRAQLRNALAETSGKR